MVKHLKFLPHPVSFPFSPCKALISPERKLGRRRKRRRRRRRKRRRRKKRTRRRKRKKRKRKHRLLVTKDVDDIRCQQRRDETFQNRR